MLVRKPGDFPRAASDFGLARRGWPLFFGATSL